MRSARWLTWTLVAIVAALAGRAAIQRWDEAWEVHPRRAADALPVYLAGAAVLDGRDPTTQEGLQAAYEAHPTGVRAATFSNLYPATAAVLAQPLAAMPWERFVAWWRALLLGGAIVGGAAGGLAGARGRGAALGAAVGAWLGAGFPATAECVALGQVNILVGGLCGLAMLAASRERDGLCGGAAALGAAIKLVPAIAAWPLFCARRWKGMAGAVLGGGAILGLTALWVPPDRVWAGVRGTLQFQSAIHPDWMTRNPAADWAVFLGALRHLPAGAWTILLAGACAALARRSDVVTAGAALGVAWIGADAAAFHVLYAPLLIPAIAYVAAWPLDAQAPRWAPIFLLAAASSWFLYATEMPDVPVEARLVVGGLTVWVACAVRLVVASWPECVAASRAAALPAGLAIGIGAAWADLWDERPRGPDPAAVGDVTGYGLPEGVGHGGPAPGGGTDGWENEPIGESPDPATIGGTPLYQVLDPPECGRLTSHFKQGPARWKAVPGELAAWIVARAPTSPCADLAYADAAVYLATERYAVLAGATSPSAAGELARTMRVLSGR